MQNPFTEKKINTAIKDMNSLIETLISELKEQKIDSETFIRVTETQLHHNDIPQDFFLIQHKTREVVIQMIKPQLRPCFYFIDEQDVHIFTDVIQEVMCYLKGTKFLN